MKLWSCFNEEKATTNHKATNVDVLKTIIQLLFSPEFYIPSVIMMVISDVIIMNKS